MRIRKVAVLSVVVVVASIATNASIFNLFKSHKKKQEEATQQASAKRRLQERMESLPGGHEGSGEPERGPWAYEKEKYLQRAYPLKQIPAEFTDNTRRQFDQVLSETKAGLRGEPMTAAWKSIGPYKALYPAIGGAAYVASGRISALAIGPTCVRGSCPIYVGAAGGGVWKTNDGLSDTPAWAQISGTFATNTVGAITVDPTDATGNTIYAGTGEPNTSADSGAGQGIYRSTDGGNTWSLLAGSSFATNNSVSSVVIDPTNRNTIYVGTTLGIRGFTEVDDGGTSGTEFPVGLYQSTDGGVTFNLLFSPAQVTPGDVNQGVNQVALDPTNPAIVYAGAFGLGIFRSSPADNGGIFEEVFVTATYNPSNEDYFSRTEFALTSKNGNTRMYVGDGSGESLANESAPAMWRNDNMRLQASALVVAGKNGRSWKMLTSSSVGDPRYATYNYCTGQCWYDNEIYTPAGQPDTVYALGSFEYGEALSNGRGVIRSTTAGDPDPSNNDRTFTDLTADSTSATAPHQLHPDQHALIFMPGNPDVWWEGSDGGLVRASGSYADISGQCAGRGLNTAETTTCERLLSSVSTKLTSLNAGLDTLQFQSLSINPAKPTSILLGGTQDNGTFFYKGSSNLWPETIGGDGGQSGFNVANPKISFHTYYAPQVDVNFRGTDPFGWDWVSDPLLESGEGSEFYIPIIADPNTAKGGSMFAGLQGVWRTRDNGGAHPYLDKHCNEYFGDFTVVCGDWVELGSTTGVSTMQGQLTSTYWGTTLAGGVVGVITRAASNTGTLWAATDQGRIFISRNADSVSTIPGADGSLVAFTRLDTLAQNAPPRFPSAIYVDPANPNHAWISYTGYSLGTPDTPGHVFSVTYNPTTGAVAWTRMDENLGDIPITTLVRDDLTGDIYAGNDFGVLRLAHGSMQWQTVAAGLPMVEVPNLAISVSARVLYAATHGRGAYVLALPSGK